MIYISKIIKKVNSNFLYQIFAVGIIQRISGRSCFSLGDFLHFSKQKTIPIITATATSAAIAFSFFSFQELSTSSSRLLFALAGATAGCVLLVFMELLSNKFNKHFLFFVITNPFHNRSISANLASVQGFF